MIAYRFVVWSGSPTPRRSPLALIARDYRR
jgi:hypothetical protein